MAADPTTTLPYELIRQSGLTVVAFPAADLRLVASPTGGAHVAPLGPTQGFDRLAGTYAALNGPMFGICAQPALDALSSEAARYAASQCDAVDYAHRDADAGLEICGSYPSRGITIAVDGGVARAHDGASCAETAAVAVQLYPTMVRGGAAVAQSAGGSNGDAEWRAALGIMADGRVGFAVGSMSMAAFARALEAAGFVDAGYTDGGGSCSLVLASGRVGASEQRRVATWLVAVAPTALDRAGKALKTAGTAVLPVVAIGGAAALVVYLVAKALEE